MRQRLLFEGFTNHVNPVVLQVINYQYFTNFNVNTPYPNNVNQTYFIYKYLKCVFVTDLHCRWIITPTVLKYYLHGGILGKVQKFQKRYLIKRTSGL